MAMPIAVAIIGVVTGLSADRPARPRDRGPDRRSDAGDDDRPRGRDRLLAVHRHPLSAPPRRRAGDRGGDRSRRCDLGQRGRLRRRNRGDRAAVAALRRDPDRQRARLFGAAVVVGVAVCGRDHAASRRSSRSSGPGSSRCGCPHVTPEHHDDRPHGWERLGPRSRRPALAGAGGRGRAAGRSRAAAARHATRPGGRRQSCPTDTTARQAYDAHQAGLRRRRKRSVPDRGRVRPSRRTTIRRASTSSSSSRRISSNSRPTRSVSRRRSSIAEGVPADQAQAEAEQQAAAQGPTQAEEAKVRPAEEVPQVDRLATPTWSSSRTRSRRIPGVEVGLPGQGRPDRQGRGIQCGRRPRRRRPTRPRTRSTGSATR